MVGLGRRATCNTAQSVPNEVDPFGGRPFRVGVLDQHGVHRPRSTLECLVRAFRMPSDSIAKQR